MFQGGHIANPCFLVFLWDNLQSERQSLRIDISCFRTVSFCIVTFCRSQWSCEIFLKRQWICLFWGMPRARWRMNVNDDFKWSVVFCVFSASIQRVVRGGAHVTESFWLEANVIKSLSVWHFPSEIRQFGHFLVFFGVYAGCWGICICGILMLLKYPLGCFLEFSPRTLQKMIRTATLVHILRMCDSTTVHILRMCDSTTSLGMLNCVGCGSNKKAEQGTTRLRCNKFCCVFGAICKQFVFDTPSKTNMFFEKELFWNDISSSKHQFSGEIC